MRLPENGAARRGNLRKDRKYLAAKQQSGLQKAIEGT